MTYTRTVALRHKQKHLEITINMTLFIAVPNHFETSRQTSYIQHGPVVPPVEEKDQGAAAVGARAKSSRIVLSLIGLCLAMLLVLWMRGGRRAMVSDRPADTPFKQTAKKWLAGESLKNGWINRNAGTNLRLVGPAYQHELCFSHLMPFRVAVGSYRQGVEVQQRQQPSAERYSLLIASRS